MKIIRPNDKEVVRISPKKAKQIRKALERAHVPHPGIADGSCMRQAEALADLRYREVGNENSAFSELANKEVGNENGHRR